MIRFAFFLVCFAASLASYAQQDYNRMLTYANEKAARGDYDGAIKDINQMIEQNPYDNQFYFYRGKVYFLQKNMNMALKDFNQAYKVDTNNIEALYFRGRCKAGINDYQGAVNDFEHLLSKDPNFTEALLEKGIANVLAGNKEAGCADIRKAEEHGLEAPDHITCD